MSKLYLNVPYSEKDEAKAFGAKWDVTRKKWYFDGDAENYIKFAKWLFNIEEAAGVMIVCDNLYILEGQKECWKCKKQTQVIGLGIEKFVDLYDTETNDDAGNPIYGMDMYGFYDEKELFVIWVENEKDLPKFIINYLKKEYNVKTGYSNVVGESFANHCEHCGTLQGNYFVFEEEDSPFLLSDDSEENKEKIEKIKIKKIKLNEDIVGYFSCGISENEGDYLKYGIVEELEI